MRKKERKRQGTERKGEIEKRESARERERGRGREKGMWQQPIKAPHVIACVILVK
jgi:hypothetical protein